MRLESPGVVGSDETEPRKVSTLRALHLSEAEEGPANTAARKTPVTFQPIGAKWGPTPATKISDLCNQNSTPPQRALPIRKLATVT